VGKDTFSSSKRGMHEDQSQRTMSSIKEKGEGKKKKVKWQADYGHSDTLKERK